MVDQWLRRMSAPQSYLAVRGLLWQSPSLCWLCRRKTSRRASTSLAGKFLASYFWFLLTSFQEWEDDYFKPRTTRDLKIRYQIGHPFGEDCPTNYLGQSGDFVVLHDNGIHVLDVDFCCCTGAPSPVAQLLNIGWFPATHKDPSTAATLSMLRRFHKLNLQARLPAYDFYNTLVILSDGAGLRKLPVRNFLSFFFFEANDVKERLESPTTVHEHGARVSPPADVQASRPRSRSQRNFSHYPG
jgi:hypothetical protein